MHAYEIFMISVFNLSKREFQMRNDFEHVFKRREREREREREKKQRGGKKKIIILPTTLLLHVVLSFRVSKKLRLAPITINIASHILLKVCFKCVTN